MWSVCIPTGGSYWPAHMCTHKHRPAHMCTHGHVSTHMCIHEHWPAHMCTHGHGPAHMCTHKHRPVHVSTHGHGPVHLCTHGHGPVLMAVLWAFFLLALGLTPSPTTNSHVVPSMMLHVCNPKFGRQRQDDQKFIPIWATENYLKRKQKGGSHFYLKFSLQVDSVPSTYMVGHNHL